MSKYGTRNRFDGKKLHTDSKFPIAFVVDATGSMDHWPGIILENLVELEEELEKYIPGFEMSITVVGDAYSDRYPKQPLQVCDFGRGKKLHNFLNSFTSRDGRHSVAGGGDQGNETYELAFLLYGPLYCEMPNAELPFLFVIGDEGYYDYLDRGHIRDLVGDKFPDSLKTLDVISDTKKHFNDNAFMFRKTYYRRYKEPVIHKAWVKALGSENVHEVESPDIINDAMIEPLKGIVAKRRGFGQKYLEGLEARKGSDVANYVKDLLGIKIGSLSDDADLLQHVESKFYEINKR